MHTFCKFLVPIISAIEAEDFPKNDLFKCIQLIRKQFKLPEIHTIPNYEKVTFDQLNDLSETFGGIFHPIKTDNLEKICHSSFPSLIQLNDDTFRVFLPNKWNKNKFYNPTTDDYEKFPNKLSVIKACQYYPISLSLAGNVKTLIQTTFKLFTYDLFVAITLTMLVALTTLIISMLPSFMFSHFDEIFQTSYWILFLIFSLILCSIALLFYSAECSLKSLAVKVSFYALSYLWNYLLNLPLKSEKKCRSAELSQKLKDYELGLSGILSTCFSLFMNVIELILLFGYLSYCNICHAVIIVFFCGVLILIRLFLIPKNIAFIQSYLLKHAKISAFLTETLLQIHKIRSAHVEKHIFKQWLVGTLDAKSQTEKALRLELFNLGVDSILPLFLLGMTYLLICEQLNTVIILQFIVSGSLATMVFGKLTANLMSLFQVWPIFNEIDQLLRDKNNISNYAKSHLLLGNIRFENIDLQNRLTNISMDFPLGKFIAIVGPSGAGKSSLFRLLLGFEIASRGDIYIDNMNIKNINQHEFRKKIGVVLQTTSLFPGTIYSNLSTNTKLTLDEAWELARFVGLDKEIEAMPMKMFTHVSDNGSESLSGGQKQKILIARALATKPIILLLDEATSALDNQSQAIIFANLARLNITRIVIAHRESTIKRADRVYVLNGDGTLKS